MKNFIDLNIKYLYEKNKLTQNEFGALFELNNGVIGTYVRGKTNPQVETMQKICNHFNLTLDDFVNKNLRTLHIENAWNDTTDYVKEPVALRGNEAIMQKTIDTQEQMIEMLQAEVRRLKGNQDYNSKTA